MRRRAPYGARGLKLDLERQLTGTGMSRPVWGAWIEMPRLRGCRVVISRRAPYGLAFYRALLACMPRNISGSSFFAAGGMALYMP